MTLQKFLKNAKSSLSIPNKKFHVCLGNESADLDSIVSAIALSYLYNSGIPLVNVSKNELSIRKDLQYLLNFLKIPEDSLITLSDINLDLLQAEKRLTLSLVDHNALCPMQEELLPSVVEVIDHHFDENTPYPNLKNKVIVKVGSLTSIIAERFLNEAGVKMTKEFATLLLAPILVDTHNLTSLEKTTEKDKWAVKTLSLFTQELDIQDFYEALFKAKEDVSNLSIDQIILKDFKEYKEGAYFYGISSLPLTVTWWIEDESTLFPFIQKIYQEKGLDLLFLLLKLAKSRRLIVFGKPSLLSAFARHAEEDSTLKETLQQTPLPSSPLLYYEVHEDLARKQLQPLLKVHLI